MNQAHKAQRGADHQARPSSRAGLRSELLAHPTRVDPPWQSAPGSCRTEKAPAIFVTVVQKPSASCTAIDTSNGRRHTDLWQLHGIGPGLIWALDQVGIKTLADLRRSQPSVVKARLGMIGSLIDLNAWIATAD